MLSFERLKELKAEFEQVRKYNDRHCMSTVTDDDVIEVLDEAIDRQSVKSEEVQEAIDELMYGSWQSSKDGYPITLGNKTIDLAVTALQDYQPWISVREKLPERGNHYLCCEYDTISIFVAYYDASGWLPPFYRETTLTHWKPLPEPPKGE